MKLPRPWFIDFETRSRAKLGGKTGVGGRNYAAHESTDVICCVLRTPDGDTIAYSAFDGPVSSMMAGAKRVRADWKPPRIDAVAAHNGTNFDRHVWRKLGWPEPREWIDTAHLARTAGMPQADLDWLYQQLLGRFKDKEGSKLTKSLSAISRAKKTFGEFRVSITPEILTRVFEYCFIDVDGMPDLWRDWLSEWYQMDLDGYEAAQIAMNDRGILFDAELAHTLLEADDVLALRACNEAGVTRAQMRSNAQFMALMAARGCPVPNAQAKTLEDLLPGNRWGNEITPDVHALILARQASSSIAAGKLRKGLITLSDDGRLRDITKYYGAHTGRESGVGIQLQNLARGIPLDIDATLALFDQGELKMVTIVE